MIIKKFVGKTEEEAVSSAKKELGNGVVIMNVREVKPKGVFALFRSKQTEVTVALESEQDPAARTLKSQFIKPQIAELSQQDFRMKNTDDIEKKLDSLQMLLENQLKSVELNKQKEETEEELTKQAEDKEGAAKADKTADNWEEADQQQDKFIRLLYNTMLDNEVAEKYANQMLEDIEKTKKPNMPFDYILANTYQKMILKFGKSEGITPNENGPKIVLFLGPTGVGKTTTIAKLASKYAVEEKIKIALLTADTYRIAAVDQLRTYANILEVPFRVIYTEEELQAAINNYKDYDYIFIDTAGHSHQNEQQLDNMRTMIEKLQNMEGVENLEYQCFLVLSATTKYRDLIHIAESYKGVAEYQLIFTKLDETDTIGNLLNIKLATDTTIAYVTHGQNVPDDIEQFNPQKTVKQLLSGRR